MITTLRSAISSAVARRWDWLNSIAWVKLPAEQATSPRKFGSLFRNVEVDPTEVVVLTRRFGLKRRGTFAGPYERGVLPTISKTGVYRVLRPFYKVNRVPTVTIRANWIGEVPAVGGANLGTA
jgi:hypothetical protein